MASSDAASSKYYSKNELINMLEIMLMKCPWRLQHACFSKFVELSSLFRDTTFVRPLRGFVSA